MSRTLRIGLLLAVAAAAFQPWRPLPVFPSLAAQAPARITGASVVVPDVDTAAARWRDVLKATVDRPRDTGSGRSATVRLPNLDLELWHPPSASSGAGLLSRRGAGLVSVTLAVADPAATVAALEAHGGREISRRADGGADVTAGDNISGWVRVVPAAMDAPRAVPPTGEPDLRVRAIGHLLLDVESGRGFWQVALGRPVPAARDTTGVPFPPDCGCDRSAFIREVNIGLDGPGVNLIAPVGGESVWRRMIARYEGLHYLQLSVRGQERLEALVAALEGAGGRRTLGAAGAPFAYVDLTGSLGLTLLLVRTE